jgi:predicted nuclease of predicted toxin-antitoxin system
VHLADLGLHHLSDPCIVVKAREQDRVILTVDLGFADLLALAREGRPSVIIFRLARAVPAAVNAALDDCLDRSDALLSAGAVLSVTDTKVRARRLPIEAHDG